MGGPADIHFMNHALNLARRGLGNVAPNPAVGCVIVKKGIVVGRGWTMPGGRPHAEAVALAQAGPQARGATAYVTLEPCAHHGETPPCAAALMGEGIRRVVVACGDPDPRVQGEGIRMLHAGGVEVQSGVLEEEAQALNRGFILRVTQKRPLVTLKTATSSDGMITAEPGKPHRITGELAHVYAHRERSAHDAILVGIGTVLADDPLLTTRVPGVVHNGVRIVLDHYLRLPADSRLAQTADKNVWVFYADDPEDKASVLTAAGVRCIRQDPGDLQGVLEALAGEGLTRLLVEGGAAVMTSFLEAGLYDRILWFRAPQEIGAGGVPALNGHDIAEMPQKFSLRQAETRALGEDLLEIYTATP